MLPTRAPGPSLAITLKCFPAWTSCEIIHQRRSQYVVRALNIQHLGMLDERFSEDRHLSRLPLLYQGWRDWVLGSEGTTRVGPKRREGEKRRGKQTRLGISAKITVQKLAVELRFALARRRWSGIVDIVEVPPAWCTAGGQGSSPAEILYYYCCQVCTYPGLVH